jgi:hypothetical protein
VSANENARVRPATERENCRGRPGVEGGELAAGFQLEGLKRRAAFKDGQHVDEWVYSRLRGE